MRHGHREDDEDAVRLCIVCLRDMGERWGHRDAKMCSIKCRNKKTNRMARGWPIADKDQGPWVRDIAKYAEPTSAASARPRSSAAESVAAGSAAGSSTHDVSAGSHFTVPAHKSGDGSHL